MKKLMLAAAIVCAAAMSHAAAVTWQSGALKDHTGAAITAKDKITGYLFELTADQYTEYAKNTTGDALSKALWADYGSKLDTRQVQGQNAYAAKGGATLNLKGTGDYTGTTDEPAHVYMAVIYVDNTSPEYFMGNIGTYDVTSSIDGSVGNLASKLAGTTTATAWSTAAVPEPTSAMLLLLGMAGLSLRRRRA